MHCTITSALAKTVHAKQNKTSQSSAGYQLARLWMVSTMTDDLIERLRGYGDGNNDLMDNAADRIEKLEAALSHYACGCKEDKCTPEEPRYRDIKCGWPARQALGGKKND